MFKAKFEEAGAKLFGSGWVFLAAQPKEPYRLEIMPLSNQDTPISHGMHALMLCDVWEHAYYLRYQNRRADWLKQFWELVNWDFVGERFAQCATKHPDEKV
jgi:Fe-Mn family superoxide dismutase